MSEQLIVVPLTRHTDGRMVASPEHGVCLPAAHQARRGRIESFDDAARDGFAPDVWTSVCGRVGIVYAHGGEFADVPICERCTASPPCGRYASVTRYNDGCRCLDCRRVASRYRREYRAARKSLCACGGRKTVSAKRCRRCRDEAARSVCGTNGRYARGCRCESCTQAHSAYQREYMRRWRAEKRKEAA